MSGNTIRGTIFAVISAILLTGLLGAGALAGGGLHAAGARGLASAQIPNGLATRAAQPANGSAPSSPLVSGTKTVCVSGCDYPTINDAVTDVNNNGLGAGGVTFNVAANHTETAPSGGIALTATGTAANQIIFQKDPSSLSIGIW
jgi:hypothetical protein